MKDYYDIVKTILTENPATRDDDMLLYGAFCARYLIVAPDETFYKVMSTAKARGLPSYESITRNRRKVQELEPELRGKNNRSRKAEQDRYRDFYRIH